jgi:NagD protein
LRSQGKRFLFVTNNSSKGTADYIGSLRERGMAVASEEILTSGHAAIRYLLHETGFRSLCLLGTPSLAEEFRAAGFDLQAAEPQAAVLGFDKTLTYRKVERVSGLLRAGLPYFATHADLVCPTEKGPIPDAGSIIALLEAATGRRPVVLGKPHRPMVEAAMERLGTPPGRTAMVGDRLYTDMKMALDHGLVPILVLSGETTQSGFEQSGLSVRFVFPHAGDLAAELERSDPS